MDSPFRFVDPAGEIQVHLPDGRVVQGRRGAPAAEFLALIADELAAPMVGAIVNSELHELTYAIRAESHLAAVTMRDADGARIYRRSLTFLLEAVFARVCPEGALLIDHSVASGGYYCHVSGRAPLTLAELSRLQDEMQAVVQADLSFQRQELPVAEAISYFEARNYPDKVRLLRHRRKPYVTLYSLQGHIDYHHGYMVPSTGYLKWFALLPAEDGFTLRFPQRSAPTTLAEMRDYPKLRASFRQYGNWLERLGIDNVGALDDALQAGRGREIILVAEALHEQHIAEIARQIDERHEELHLILIAGPSSSGKTTFSRRLTVQLLARGISPFALELDNYFVDRQLTPQDEKGQLDFEALEALDLALLASHLHRLSRGEKVQMPHYDFKSGTSQPGEVVQLKAGQPIILEGIHGLNPRLIPAEMRGSAFTIYISALTQLNLDRHNRVSTTDTRLIRRIVRDARERGYTAQQTIQRWESVRRGEEKYIFPFQENADVMFNSALVYELSALKPLAEPLLRQVTYGTPEFIEAKRLLAFLEWFLPMDSSEIPDNSLMREFLGGSALRSFRVWSN